MNFIPVLRRWARPAFFGLAMLSAALPAGCGKQTEATFERPPAPVSVATASTEDAPVYIDAVGKMVAREVVSIQPQVSGRITGIHFTDGADVKAGELLFTIDPRPFQAQLYQAEANLAQAEAALSLAKVTFARVDSVSDPRAVSRQDYDTKKNAVEAAEALVKQTARRWKTRPNLEYATIRSPISAAPASAPSTPATVSANNGSLLVIQRLDPIYADFTVTKQLSEVQRNMASRTLGLKCVCPTPPTNRAKASSPSSIMRCKRALPR
jgi:multidrug efflux system membrane fusion protein